MRIVKLKDSKGESMYVNVDEFVSCRRHVVSGNGYGCATTRLCVGNDTIDMTNTVDSVMSMLGLSVKE